MDAVALLRRAQEVGLRVEPIGDKLLVRGPKRAEAVVELLAAHKAEVLAALAPASTSKCTDRDAAVARRWRDRLVGKMTLDVEGPLYYRYYEEIHKGGYLDATIRAGNCSERK